LRDILGLRHEERRHAADRRQGDRGLPDRRQASRRGRTVRSVLFGMFAVALPSSSGTSTPVPARIPAIAIRPPQGFVSVSEAFRVVPASIAYNDAIAEAANRYELDPDLIRAIIRAESAFDVFAVSSAGAQGLMQLMPEVADELDVMDPFDPRQNILGGARYLRWLLDRHHGDLELAVASYNAGPGAVDRYNGIPPFRETVNYVKSVKRFLRNSRRSDGD
jgi:soluble lytic murein transglycosylase-like protein